MQAGWLPTADRPGATLADCRGRIRARCYELVALRICALGHVMDRERRPPNALTSPAWGLHGNTAAVATPAASGALAHVTG